jgi:hypothetical protein
MNAIRLRPWTFLAFGWVFMLNTPLEALDFYETPDITVGWVASTWTLQIGAMRHVITFTQVDDPNEPKDGMIHNHGIFGGTFKGTLYVGSQIADQYEGTWKLNPGLGFPTLSYVYTRSRLLAPGTKDSDSIQTLNSRVMVVLTSGGHGGTVYRTWQRVQDK